MFSPPLLGRGDRGHEARMGAGETAPVYEQVAEAVDQEGRLHGVTAWMLDRLEFKALTSSSPSSRK